MIKALCGAVRFFWVATPGHRLRPWRSEYLRWRMETFTGKPADTVGLRDFVRLAVKERRQMGRFLVWTSEMHEIATETKR